MDWLALLLKLAHVVLAFPRWSPAWGPLDPPHRAPRRPNGSERAHLLADAASPFERIVQMVSPLVVVVGLVTAWAQGYPWLGLTTGWMLLTVLLIIPIFVIIPTIFLPRGRVFEAEMVAARAAGEVTPGLRAAWADRPWRWPCATSSSRSCLIVALMVLKPF